MLPKALDVDNNSDLLRSKCDDGRHDHYYLSQEEIDVCIGSLCRRRPRRKEINKEELERLADRDYYDGDSATSCTSDVLDWESNSTLSSYHIPWYKSLH